MASLSGIRGWFLQELEAPKGPYGKSEHTHPWWQAMCLTGVDYFSTLGYQPGIAFLAAGALSPIATVVLVLVTLFAAYPVYSKVAEQSPNGQGSIAMLERLFPGWKGKTFVLCLLGFAATDFVITITLSAADGTAHLIQNPFLPKVLHHQVGLTLLILAILGAVFINGFREAMGIAVVLVGVYLVLNAVVIAVTVPEVLRHPEIVSRWRQALWQSHPDPWGILAVSLLVFPKLALGLSGFETGVAVMPLISGDRILNTKKLLFTAALIMSVFLIASSMVTTLLIEPSAFQSGGPANGRALAFLAHRYLGSIFGSCYDISTIAILSFAGASAMAGLLNLVPRYLPRYGMAPDWARASRPLVAVFVAICFLVTLAFHADVDAQGGAYATGVLVLMSSAAIAVAISRWRQWTWSVFALISLVFIYTTISNIIQRPEGIKIAGIFIFLILLVSMVSRALRSTEFRVETLDFDHRCRDFLAEDNDGVIRFIAHRPGNGTAEEYAEHDRAARINHNLDADEQLLFLEVARVDASDFTACLRLEGIEVSGFKIMRTSSPAVPNAIAAILVHVQQHKGHNPHVYFRWTEGNPVQKLFRFIFLGEGDVAPVTQEILRKNIPDPRLRPVVHVA